MNEQYEVIEKTEFKNRKGHEFWVSLLKSGNEWGIHASFYKTSIFGYSEKGARERYKKLIDSYSR